MGKLIISRRKEWINKARKYNIFIDGVKKEVINNNEVKEIELEAGEHQLVLKVDWCSSPEFKVNILDDKAKSVEVSNFKQARWIYPIFYVVFGAFMLIKWIYNIYVEEFMYLVFPLVLILFYYLSFGRKKYLVIKEL